MINVSGFRNLPGEEKDLRRTLQKIIADPGVKVSYSRDVGSGPPSPIKGPVLASVRKVAAIMAPGVPILPTMSAGATDSRHVRAAGIHSYGLKPFPSAAGESRIHGANERMRAESLGFGVEFLHRTIEELAQSRTIDP